MNYLSKAGILSAGGSFLGNRAIRGMSEGKPLVMNTGLVLLDPLNIFFVKNDNNNKGFPEWKYPNDLIAIGIGAVAPLLISGFLKKSLRDSDKFHGFASMAVSAAFTFYLICNEEKQEPKDDATKNNKPNDDDKPSKKKSEPPAITQLSEQDKRVLSEYKEPDSGRLSPVSKKYYDHFQHELNTTPNKAQLLKLKSKLDELAKKQEKETKENITKEINKAITTCNRLALERDYGVIETKYKECSELLKNAPEDIKRSSQDSMQQITRQLKEKITNDIYSSISLSPTQKPNIQTIISQLDIPTAIKTLNFARSIGVASSNYRGFNHQQKINYLDAKIQTVRSTPQSKLSVAKIHILELIKQNQNRINFTQHRQEHDFIGTNVQSFL